MSTYVIINIALSIPVFAVIIGLALWSFATQQGDRPHVFAARRRRIARANASRPQFAARREAWPAR